MMLSWRNDLNVYLAVAIKQKETHEQINGYAYISDFGKY